MEADARMEDAADPPIVEVVPDDMDGARQHISDRPRSLCKKISKLQTAPPDFPYCVQRTRVWLSR